MSATAIVLTAVVTVALIRVWNKGGREIAAVAQADPSCDLQTGPCRAEFPGGGRIDLSIHPRPIEGLKPLRLEVHTEGLEARSVEVDFRGLGMEMGYNRPQLERGADGNYSGAGMISVCVLGRMFWEVTVLANTKAGVLAAPFRFETVPQ